MPKLEIDIPDEFRELCEDNETTPETVLKGLIADLCGLDGNHGSDERLAAQGWFGRVMWSMRTIWPVRKAT